MPTMIRPAWDAEEATEAERKALTEAIRLAKKKNEYEALMWAAIIKARSLGIPDPVICDQTGESRATLNRKYGPRSASKDEASDTRTA